MAGKGYPQKITYWQSLGYHVSLIFPTLPDAQTAIARVTTRVSQGGHHIPDDVIIRRFHAGLANLPRYIALVDQWAVYDNEVPMHPQSESASNFLGIVYSGLQASAKEAERLAVLTNTPLVRSETTEPAVPKDLAPMLGTLGKSVTFLP